MFNKVKQEFDSEIEKYARKNIIKKLKKQGIDHTQLSREQFNELLEDEIKILKHDTKRIGQGIGIGLAISLLTGF